MTKETDAEPLTGGERTAVARRGDVVIRDTGPWGRSVHALLRHLHLAGFAGAPRVVGDGFDDEGRELLSYIEGEVINPAPWSDEAMHDLGRLIRQLHDATASFRPPADAVWRPWFGRTVGTPDIIGHCDAAPWNVISRHGKPIALIDWEAAGPVDRLTDIAMAAWSNAQLYDDDVAEMNGLPQAEHRIRQVRIFADAYGYRPMTGTGSRTGSSSSPLRAPQTRSSSKRSRPKRSMLHASGASPGRRAASRG